MDSEFTRIIYNNIKQIDKETVRFDLLDIFNKIKIYRHDHFYDYDEISLVLKDIDDDIFALNVELFKEQSETYSLAIYSLIDGIFDELIIYAEDTDQFEMAQNLMYIKENWFATMV
jgi:hypothetical protein